MNYLLQILLTIFVITCCLYSLYSERKRNKIIIELYKRSKKIHERITPNG